MAMADSKSALWEQIELSESYLVCSMCEEAAYLASSVLNEIRDDVFGGKATEDIDELHDMMESVGMVLVQSLNQLGRASQIVSELKVLFVSGAIPVQVLLSGVCFQMAEGSCVGVQEFLEEFLGNCRYLDGRCYVVSVEGDLNLLEGCDGGRNLELDRYIAVVEIYAVTLLAAALKEVDLSIAWVEKAALPEEKRQEILRRLHSLYSHKATNLSQDHSALLATNHGSRNTLEKELNVSEGSPEVSETNFLPDGPKHTKQAILKFSRRINPCFWWFHSINLKIGNIQLVISNGKIVFGCLIVLIVYVLQKKRALLNRMIRSPTLSIKKALVDLWQLAFSYQVNPLAAIPVPAATR